jgi:hypothetical protein
VRYVIGSRQDQIIQANCQDFGILEVVKKESHVFSSRIELTPKWQTMGIGSRGINDILSDGKDAGRDVRLHVPRKSGFGHYMATLGLSCLKKWIPIAE